jgi:hypothetical protein
MMQTNRKLLHFLVPVLVVVALLVLPMSAYAAPAPGVRTMVVRAPLGLNLRQDPSLAGRLVLVLRNGELVRTEGNPVFRQGISWSFVEVRRGGVLFEGFCATAYLAISSGQPPADQHGLKVVAPAGLKLRSGPGTSFGVVRIVPFGTILRPTGRTQFGSGLLWNEVMFDGRRVWAASAFLRAV